MRLRILAVAGCTSLMWLAGCSKSAPTPPSQTEVSEFSSAINDAEPDPTTIDRLLSAKPALANTPTTEGKMPLKVAEEKHNDELVKVIKKHGGHE